MIKYVGIKTAKEASKIDEEFILKTEKHNKEVRTRRNITILIIIGIAALVAAVVWNVFESVRQDVTPITAGIVLVLVTLTLSGASEDMHSTEKWDKPIAYQFFQATNEMTLLKSEIRYNQRGNNQDLWLTLKNSKNEVSHACISGLKAITKTDIKDTIVNLDEGIVYSPYQE